MERQRPKLALLDLVLPDIDGIELWGRWITWSSLSRPRYWRRASGRRCAAGKCPSPLEPYVLGVLAIDYSARRVSVVGQQVQLTTMDYRLLAELSVNAGKVLNYEHLLERVWNEQSEASLNPMRTLVAKLRTKLGEDARNPRYVITETRVRYWMPEGEGEPASQ